MPKIHGVKVSKQGNDIDYGCRWFGVGPKGEAGAEHCSGLLWGSGLPFDHEVWSATEYSENAYQDYDGQLITDARGKTEDGKTWRVLGHAFETVTYRRISTEDAAVLDRVIDGACVEPVRFGFDRFK